MFKFARVLKFATVAVAVGVVAGGLLVGALWVEHTRPVTLPQPSGAYAVGRENLVWTEPNQGDGAASEMAVWIWYPARVDASRPTKSAYLPPALADAVKACRGRIMSRFLTRDLAKVRAHAVQNAPVADEPKAFPVLLLRTGASAEVWNYTTLAEDLASHGYVVVGFDIPGRTNVVLLQNGKVVQRTWENDVEAVGGEEQVRRVNRLLADWTRDMRWTLDELARMNASDARFKGRLDLQRVGAFGHSFGGTQSARFCEIDPRCRAGVDIDGGLFGDSAAGTINQPFMFLMCDHRGEHGAESEQIARDIRAMYDRLPVKTRAYVTIRGANHFFFSDDSGLLKSRLLIGALHLFGIAKIDGRRQLALTAACVRAFFDEHLKNDAAPMAELQQYPELEIGE